MTWRPNATVATVVFDGHRYLLVEETDKRSGQLVLNQPAGHLESGESLAEAALRETLEETGWRVTLKGLISVGLYTPPVGPVTYHRTTFLAEPEVQVGSELDPDIIGIHWLEYPEIVARSAKLRSPLVLDAIERHRRGEIAPLSLLVDFTPR
jgi:8-oxo-dGTP pyrophosphatase MutT (NUDIX family)